MTPWTRIDSAETPDGTRLELLRRGGDFSIRANGQLLMNTRVHGSEEALAEMALTALGARPRPHVLIGGLGCGYTLAATLARVGAEARVSVVEIVPAVVRWNREVLGDLNGRPLDDPRARVIEADICELLRGKVGQRADGELRADGGRRAEAAPKAEMAMAAGGAPPRVAERFDAILLDVDNGPRAVARETNGWLYSPAGLAAAWSALEPGGVLAVWSAGPEVGFSERLRGARFQVRLERVRARPGRTRQQHFIWLATRDSDARR